MTKDSSMTHKDVKSNAPYLFIYLGVAGCDE